MGSSLEIIRNYMPALMGAMPMTLYLLFGSVIAAVIFGFLLAWAKLSKNVVARYLSSIYISFMRGTPMMVQILLIFILVPVIAYQNGIDTGHWNPSIYALIAYSMNLSAFFAEIFRSAYIGLDYRQIEAAQSLGMSSPQIFRRVILPQGAVTALPNLTNMSLEQMKNISIASVIGVYDILGKATQLAKNNYGVGQLQLYLTVGVIFWIMGLIILFISNRVTVYLSKENLVTPKVVQGGM